MKENTIKSLKETTEKEIETCKIMIGFYEQETEGKEKQESAEILLKAQKIKGSLDFNERFIKYLNSL
jgi:hypothetical protein